MNRAEKFMFQLAYPDVNLSDVAKIISIKGQTLTIPELSKTIQPDWFVIKFEPRTDGKQHIARIKFKYDQENNTLVIKENSYASIHKYPDEAILSGINDFVDNYKG